MITGETEIDAAIILHADIKKGKFRLWTDHKSPTGSRNIAVLFL
jgi:hypothetical protein